MTPPKHAEGQLQNLCTNMHAHTYTHVYTCMRIPIHIHMQIYTYMHVHTHTYIHTYTHTHTTCTYAHTQARLERQRCSDCVRSWCRHGFFVRCNQPRLAPPMLGLHCTHLLWRSSAQLDNGPLRSCRKNGGKAAVQQSPSRRARRTPSLMMMIAFITVRSSLVPLIEGLCAQIYFRFEILVVCVHIFCFSFSEEKIC